ncbi:hypothetical protein [Bradyrhizobium ganzhouense]|uniref:hypothetical protein n=1 Tax=Bradyrhizobium ganzhouense TaxID=1179767 RepID=UPI003CF68B54
MNVPMHRLPIHHGGKITKALFGLIVGMWSSLAAADERSLAIAPGREFSAESYVHKPLADDAPLDPQSRSYVANLQRQIKKYYDHPDVNIDGGTPPVYIVPIDQPTVRVKYVAWDRPGEAVQPLQAQWETVPLPDDFQPPAPGGDAEAVVYQPSTGKMWEFWRIQKTGATAVNSAGKRVDEWGANWGGRMDNIATNPGYWVTTPDGYKFGATASGIPFLAGLITIDELQRGAIDHVVGFALPETLAEHWSYPAQRTDGNTHGADAIPEGAIFRLPAGLNLDQMDMDPFARMIAKAVQKHGMILWDISGVVGFRAENPANRYPDGHPFWKQGGILRCPAGVDASDPNNQVIYECWAPERLRDFPWDKLQALKTRMAK